MTGQRIGYIRVSTFDQNPEWRLDNIKSGNVISIFKTRLLMASLSLIARYPKRYRVTTDSQHNPLRLPPIYWTGNLPCPDPIKSGQPISPTIRTYQGWQYLAIVMD